MSLVNLGLRLLVSTLNGNGADKSDSPVGASPMQVRPVSTSEPPPPSPPPTLQHSAIYWIWCQFHRILKRQTPSVGRKVKRTPSVGLSYNSRHLAELCDFLANFLWNFVQRHLLAESETESSTPSIGGWSSKDGGNVCMRFESCGLAALGFLTALHIGCFWQFLVSAVFDFCHFLSAKLTRFFYEND